LWDRLAPPLRELQLLMECAAQRLDLHEGVHFWLLAGIAAGVVSGVGCIRGSGVRHGLASIAYLKFTLFFLYTATVLGSLGMRLLDAHLLKGAWEAVRSQGMWRGQRMCFWRIIAGLAPHGIGCFAAEIYPRLPALRCLPIFQTALSAVAPGLGWLQTRHGGAW
jgi:hypothetical protein